MITLIKNETIKLLRRTKTLVVFIGLIGLTALICFSMYRNYAGYKRMNTKAYKLNEMQQTLDYLDDQKSKASNEADKAKLDAEITNIQTQINNIKNSKDGKENWKTKINEELKDDKEHLSDNSLPDLEKASIKNRISYLQYFANNNIEYVDENIPTASKYVKDLGQVLGVIFLAAGIAVFAADMVSGEYTPPTMKVLLTQPVSRGKVLLSKFISVFLTSAVLISIVEFAGFLLMGAVYGFGSMKYPVQVGQKLRYDISAVTSTGSHPLAIVPGSVHIISMGQYIAEVYLLQLLFIAAAVAFAFLLSTVMKSSMISVSSSIVIVILFTIFEEITPLRKALPFLFTTYGDPNKLITGGIVIEGLKNPTITVGEGIVVLVLWTAVCYLISHIVFTKKDMLI